MRAATATTPLYEYDVPFKTTPLLSEWSHVTEDEVDELKFQTVFLSASNVFLPARRYASAGLCDSDVSVCPSVCLDVCHTPVLCLAERKQDREMYTI